MSFKGEFSEWRKREAFAISHKTTDHRFISVRVEYENQLNGFFLPQWAEPICRLLLYQTSISPRSCTKSTHNGRLGNQIYLFFIISRFAFEEEIRNLITCDQSLCSSFGNAPKRFCVSLAFYGKWSIGLNITEESFDPPWRLKFVKRDGGPFNWRSSWRKPIICRERACPQIEAYRETSLMPDPTGCGDKLSGIVWLTAVFTWQLIIGFDALKSFFHRKPS
jgi:hypothetical protein